MSPHLTPHRPGARAVADLPEAARSTGRFIGSLVVSASVAATVVAAGPGTVCFAAHVVSPARPLVLPIREVIGGTGVDNNAKNNPNGGYYSVYDHVREFSYPNTHANQLGNTAMVNDHVYWDSSPGGLDHTHVPHPDSGGGRALWWPIPGEWVSYRVDVAAPATYTVLYRFSTSWGPSRPVVIHMTMDGVSSGPIEMAPDDPNLWQDRRHLCGGWWGHTVVSGTSKMGWHLERGSHVLKVHIDSFPDKKKDHGNIWIHYFKVMAGGVPVVRPAKTPARPKRESAAARAEAKRELQLAALRPFRTEISDASKSLMDGDFAGATRHVERGARKATDEAAKKSLAQLLLGFRSAAELKQLARDGIADGGSRSVSLYMMGRNVRARVLGADARVVNVAILGGGPTMDLSWGKLTPRGLASIALKLQKTGNRRSKDSLARMRAEYEAALALVTGATAGKR